MIGPKDLLPEPVGSASMVEQLQPKLGTSYHCPRCEVGWEDGRLPCWVCGGPAAS